MSCVACRLVPQITQEFGHVRAVVLNMTTMGHGHEYNTAVKHGKYRVTWYELQSMVAEEYCRLSSGALIDVYASMLQVRCPAQ